MNKCPPKEVTSERDKKEKKTKHKKTGEKKLMKEEKGENNRFFRYSKKFVFELKDLVLVVSLTTN